MKYCLCKWCIVVWFHPFKKGNSDAEPRKDPTLWNVCMVQGIYWLIALHLRLKIGQPRLAAMRGCDSTMVGSIGSTLGRIPDTLYGVQMHLQHAIANFIVVSVAWEHYSFLVHVTRLRMVKLNLFFPVIVMLKDSCSKIMNARFEVGRLDFFLDCRTSLIYRSDINVFGWPKRVQGIPIIRNAHGSSLFEESLATFQGRGESRRLNFNLSFPVGSSIEHR